MLAALRKGTASWLAKIFIGLLVLSFAVWGIADIFGGYNRQTVAEVGDTEINYNEFQRDYRNQMRAFGSRFGRQLTQEEARALGLDRQVIQGLIHRAAIENQGKELNLGISDAAIAQRIMQEENFRDTSGKFNRAIFEQLLRANGLSEGLFVAQQREAYVREQLTSTVAGEVAIPKTLLRATDIYRNQTRKLKYFTLPIEKLDPIEEPTAETLQNYYDANKTRYTAPEYRKLGILEVLPEDLAKKITISDEELKAHYDANQAAYSKAETRTIEQIPFPDKTAARKAYEKIQAGSSFEEIARERDVTDEDLRLGVMTKSDLVDRVVADVAFALGEGEVSEPVEGSLSTVLLRVTKIEPAKVTSFEEAKDGIRDTLAKDRAIQQVNEYYGKVEDERAAGVPLEEIANRFGLKFITIPAVARSGDDPNGTAVGDIPAQRQVLREAFLSDVGVENDPVETENQGLVWFDVLAVTPPKLKPFADIRDEVAKDWREAEVSSRLAARARELVDRAKKGQALGEIAADLELDVKESEELKRDTSTENFPKAAVTQAFALSKGGFGSSPSEDGEARIVFEVISVTDPGPLETEAADALKQSLQPQITADLIDQYVNGLSKTYGVTKNQQLIDQLTGAAPGDSSGRRGTSY